MAQQKRNLKVSMKTVLMTGANRGLGLGHVEYCVQRGYQVIAASRNEAPALNALKEVHGERLELVTLDVGSEKSIAELGRALVDRNLDLVLSNAAICLEENLGEWSAAAFADTMRVNVTGPALLSQALLPCMTEGSKLINVSSGMGALELNINPEAPLDSYAASKAALNMLTRRLAEKVRSRGIIVVAMSPGWVRTAMGGEEAPVSVEDAVADMHKAIEALTLEDSGAFLSEVGEVIAW